MRKATSLAATATLLIVASASISFAQAPPAAQPRPGAAPARPAPPPFRIMSPDLVDGAILPQQFSCAARAEAVSPPLQWMNAPRDTVSYTLIVHDMEPRPQKKLDDILNWMVWNIPGSATRLPQGIPSNTADLPDGSHQTNGNPGNGGIIGFRPPCPPPNVPLLHHYAFEMYALDTDLNLPATATRADVMKAMDGHIVAHDSVVVPFNR